MNAIELTNEQLFDELARRLKADGMERQRDEIERLENEIHRLNKCLRQAENGKSQFLSNVRNEINNPLASIIGLAASIQGISLEDKVKRLSALIQKQASDLDFQMRNIMMAAEIELGQVAISPAMVNVVSLLEGIVTAFKYKIEECQVAIQLDVADRLNFRTDANILETICINLLANGIQYSGTNKLVVAELRVNEEWLEVVVHDFGVGMSEEVQRNLFQRFVRGESGCEKVHAGHGLGLSITSALVSQLGGKIELQSALKVGTTVKVSIPQLPASAYHVTSFGNELLFSTDQEF